MAYPSANIFVKHLDSIHDSDTIWDMQSFLNNFDPQNTCNKSVLLFMSPDAILLSKWKDCLESLAKKNIVHLIVFDEAHYIPLAGRCLRPAYSTNLWFSLRQQQWISKRCTIYVWCFTLIFLEKIYQLWIHILVLIYPLSLFLLYFHYQCLSGIVWYGKILLGKELPFVWISGIIGWRYASP